MRWARSVGDGLYGCPWEDVPFNRAPELDDQTAIVVDQLVLRSERGTRKLIELWYRTKLPEAEIARRIVCDQNSVILRWNAALWHFKSHFENSPLTSLRRLAQIDVADRTHVVYTESVKWASRLCDKPAA